MQPTATLDWVGKLEAVQFRFLHIESAMEGIETNGTGPGNGNLALLPRSGRSSAGDEESGVGVNNR